MTVAMPVSLPTPAVAGKAGSAAPSKGVASAPGQNGKAAGDGADATQVAGMFAALVAALTQQMQPVDGATATTPTLTAGAEGEEAVGVEGAVAALVAPALAMPAGQITAAAADVQTPVDAAAAAATGEAPAVVLPAPDAVTVTDEVAQANVPTQVAEATQVTEVTEVTEPTQGVDATDEPIDVARAVTEPAADGDAADPNVPAGRAIGRSDVRVDDQERPTPPSGTIPATPAQPAPGAGPATPAVAATPAGKVAEAEVQPVVGLSTAPVNPAPTTPAEAVAAPTAPPAAAADPHLQIARIVRPLQLGADGAYELALDLTPAELGRVRIDVELRGTTIHLSLRADNPATRDLLQGSLNQLRAELEGAGLQAGNLDVGGQHHDGREAAGDEASAMSSQSLDEEPTAAAATTPTTTSETDADTGVDVLA